MHSFKTVLLIGALGIAAQTRSATAAPAWCQTPGVDQVTPFAVAGFDEVTQKDPRRALRAIVAWTCNFDANDAKAQPNVLDAARATWTKQLDLTEADWADIAAWSTQKQGDRNHLRLSHADKQALSALDPLDQYAAIANTKYTSGDAHYMIDALEPGLSEAGRFAYLEICLESRRPIEWAMCQADANALDTKKLSNEIRAAKSRPPQERAVLRIALDLARPKLVERAAAINELLAKEPGYETLFKLANDARKSYKVKNELLDLALAMDDARVLNSTKAFAGCDDKTWPALSSAIGAIPAERFSGLKNEPGNSFLDNVPRVLINDPNAYVAAAAHVTCHSDQADALVQALASAMQRWPGFRGPRNAAHTAMITANVKLDARDAQIDWPSVRRFSVRAGNVKWSGGHGPVSAVKRAGAQITVEFVKKLRKESVCTDWKDTNKIVMISPSGQVIYDYICTKRGTITVNDASPPNVVAARYTYGLKAGVAVTISSGVVAGVWSKPGGKLIAVLGTPVK